MRLSLVALIGLAACGVSVTSKADPPTVVDPWSSGEKPSPVVEVIDPWKAEARRLDVVEVVDPWNGNRAVPTRAFPVVAPVVLVLADPWARAPARPVRKTGVPTGRFPLVEVIDPWRR